MPARRDVGLDQQSAEIVLEASTRAWNIVQSEPELKKQTGQNLQAIIRFEIEYALKNGERDIDKLTRSAVAAVRQREQIRRSARSLTTKSATPSGHAG